MLLINGKHWFVHDDKQIGPYDTLAEMREDQRGLARFDKYGSEPGYATTDEPTGFTLANDPPKRKKADFGVSERTKQKPLIEGLGCLPNQLDLF